MKKIQIFRNKKNAIIYLNSKIYSKKSILITIQEFKHLINSKVLKINNFYVIEIENKSKEIKIDKIIKEFSNYLLYLEFQNQNSIKDKLEFLK
jgi:alpha-acetolactate decarboxylase